MPCLHRGPGPGVGDARDSVVLHRGPETPGTDEEKGTAVTVTVGGDHPKQPSTVMGDLYHGVPLPNDVDPDSRITIDLQSLQKRVSSTLMGI